MYRPSSSNKNADALSRLPQPSPSSMKEVAFGITVPEAVEIIVDSSGKNSSASISTVEAVPAWSKVDLQILKQEDPMIQTFLLYWRQGTIPMAVE